MDRATGYREQARQHLERYLYILERQYESIQLDDADTLEFYLQEGRESLAALEAVHRAIHTLGAAPPPEGTDLMARVRRQHRANRDLLAERKDELGRRISAINVPRRGRSIFQAPTHGGSSVDLSL